jgi:hypothetical protein
MGTAANVLIGVASVTIGETAVGYTADGVMMTVSSDFFDAKVEEIVGTIKRVLVDQEVEVTLNMAEGSLANMAEAIPGSSLDTNTLTLGGAALQEKALVLVGKNPAGFDRTITLTLVNPVGAVGIPYKKGEISVVPVTFKALADDSGEFGTIVDSTE